MASGARKGPSREAFDRVGHAGCGSDSRLHAYFGGNVASGAEPGDFLSAADFHDRKQVDAGARIGSALVGNSADQ